MEPGSFGLQQPFSRETPGQAGAGGRVPAVLAKAANGKGRGDGLAEVGGLQVGRQPEGQLIDEGLAGVEIPLMEHPGLQLDRREYRVLCRHQGAVQGTCRHRQGGGEIGAKGQGGHLARAGIEQVQGDLPASQAAALGTDPLDADPPDRKLAQQRLQVEILIAVQPVGLDDEQPVALAHPRQQLGLDRSGLHPHGAQGEQQPAADPGGE